MEGHRSRLSNGSDDAKMLYAFGLSANIRYDQGLYIESERLLRRVLRGRSVFSHQNRDYVHVIRYLGRIAEKQGKLIEAELAHRQATEEAERLYGSRDVIALEIARDLGSTLR